MTTYNELDFNKVSLFVIYLVIIAKVAAYSLLNSCELECRRRAYRGCIGLIFQYLQIVMNRWIFDECTENGKRFHYLYEDTAKERI